jgi:hypothetical protein
MTIQLSAHDIDLEMRRYPTEFNGFRESMHEWALGSWTLSKSDKNGASAGHIR